MDGAGFGLHRAGVSLVTRAVWVVDILLRTSQNLSQPFRALPAEERVRP